MSLLNSKKIKELESENESLKKQIKSFHDKENRLKQFEELIKNAHLEYSDIISKKDQTAQKLEVLEKDKTKLLGELNKISVELKQLREMKFTEQNQLTLLEEAFRNPGSVSEIKDESFSKSKMTLTNEIEAAEKRKNDIALDIFNLRRKFDNLNNKINEGKKVLEKLNSDIEKKKEEISHLMDRQRNLIHSEKELLRAEIVIQNEKETENKILALREQENKLVENINVFKKQLDELKQQIEEKQLVLSSSSTDNQSQTSSSLSEIKNQELTLELDIKTKALQAQVATLTEELKAKTDSNNELQSENKELLENISSGKEELAKINESIEIDTIRLTDLDYSLNILDNELDKLKEEIKEKKNIRRKIEEQIKIITDEKIDLEDILKELKETTTIIAQLKNDIERGTGQSAKRFTGILQYYSSMIKDFYKKKSDVEKALAQKEKELEEKQRLIDDRQTAISEMENILYVRYNRAGIIKELTQSIAEQRKLFEGGSFIPIDSEVNNDSLLSKNIPHKKLIEFENALKEILSGSDKYALDLINRRLSFEKDILSSKSRLGELNRNIKHSTNELSELKNSIDKIKIEHEDHRVSINKLASVKTKLEEQINSYKNIIDKYAMIKEKIREEQELIKKKRDLTKQINSSTQTADTHNTRWIKL